MKIKIRIRTPKGQATKTQKRIYPYIIKCKRNIQIDSYTSKDDDEIFWEVEGPVRKLMGIMKRVYRFDEVIKTMLNSKVVRKTIRKHLPQDQEAELDDMLLNHTSCEMVTEASAEEIAESQKGWWQRVKETYKKGKVT